VATRRNFTQEYKDQAVSLVLDSGRSIAEVAKSIGVHEMTLAPISMQLLRPRVSCRAPALFRSDVICPVKVICGGSAT
jgi:hypothetical protein